ncbi:hypothetical protein CAC42_3136 [Sphaceloma murrayae]|uniref:cutinase n=1 Tax=Sphaceloma murrayae TaxID=2082308 RepID=A0A2K1QRS4_9PEZI|nr:hypothetical protein CAC42_3136 [Sphaceloma murrayae]
MKLTLLLPFLPLALSSPISLQRRATAYSTGSTASDITSGRCAALSVIYARGTGEGGNIGFVAGPPLFKALKSKLGGEVNLQGVTYPASSAGNANQGGDGGPAMRDLANRALSQCPGTKVVLVGYSQGAMVVHNAVQRQGFAAAQVAAAVLFGDPLIKQSVGAVPAAKVKQFCAPADSICGNRGSGAGHTSYGSNANEAADFIIRTAGATA